MEETEVKSDKTEVAPETEVAAKTEVALKTEVATKESISNEDVEVQAPVVKESGDNETQPGKSPGAETKSEEEQSVNETEARIEAINKADVKNDEAPLSIPIVENKKDPSQEADGSNDHVEPVENKVEEKLSDDASKSSHTENKAEHVKDDTVVERADIQMAAVESKPEPTDNEGSDQPRGSVTNNSNVAKSETLDKSASDGLQAYNESSATTDNVPKEDSNAVQKEMLDTADVTKCVQEDANKTVDDPKVAAVESAVETHDSEQNAVVTDRVPEEDKSKSETAAPSSVDVTEIAKVGSSVPMKMESKDSDNQSGELQQENSKTSSKKDQLESVEKEAEKDVLDAPKSNTNAESVDEQSSEPKTEPEGSEVASIDTTKVLESESNQPELPQDKGREEQSVEERHQVIAIVEQIDEPSDVQLTGTPPGDKDKTEDMKVTETDEVRKEAENVNNSADDVQSGKDSPKGDDAEKGGVTEELVQDDKSDVKLPNAGDKSVSKTESVGEQKTEKLETEKSKKTETEKPKKTETEKTSTGGIDGAPEERKQNSVTDSRDNVRQDGKDTTRDRPSKSYSAQRNANRSNRRGGNVEDKRGGNAEEPKSGRVESAKGGETNLRNDKNRTDERRDKDRDRDRIQDKDKDKNRVSDRDRSDGDRVRDKDRNQGIDRVRRDNDRDRNKDRNRGTDSNRRDNDRDRERDRNRGTDRDRRESDRDRIRDRDKDRNKDKDRDREQSAKVKDERKDRNQPKEAEKVVEKNKSSRDDKRDRDDRRDRRSSQETKRSKTREEREQEEAERRKKEEERRKKREEDRKRLEEEKKRRDEEKKRKEEERKQKEEEERKREEERKAEEERKRLEEEQKRLEEEAARQREEEEKQAKEISVEAEERKEVKMEMRKKNLNAADYRPDDESFFFKLDSSLKKNTAFVKKLKVMTESQRLSLTKEFNTLNLTKYVGEVATSIAEAKLKMADISCAIQMCSIVHQRYSEFSSYLLQAIQKILPALPSKKDKDKDKDEQKSVIVFDSKIRTELRFLAELIVAGVFTEKEGLPVLNGVLSAILNSDKESHSNLPIIISFTKHCGEDYAGFVPRKNRIIAEKFGLTLPSSEIFSPQVKNAYKNLLKDHYASVTKYLLKKHKELQKLELQNMRMLQTKGELSDERKKVHEELQALHQKLLMNTSTLADLIDEDVPDLPIDEKLQEENELMAMDFLTADGSSVEFDFETSLWEDEDTRTFHENLIDLRTMVPAILFKDAVKQAAPGDKSEEDLDKFDEDIQAMEVSESTQEEDDEEDEEVPEEGGGNKAEEDDMGGEVESGEPETEEAEDEEEEEEGPASNVSMKVMLDAFLQKLPECVNRDFIDKAAVEFCMNLNTKANRRKLVKALFNVPRTRLDLLSFYSRLVATLYPCMPDIATDLVEKLKQDFRWHMRKKDQMKIESKIKIVRFLGELTKFKMCPKADTLQCLKQLLLVFHHHAIDMACNLLDVCGRYLYRSKDSHLRTKALLDLMMRKRNKMHMNERHSTMVENAFFYCNPPESKQMEQKVRPPLHEYIRKLLFKDLTKITVEKVLKQMRKLPWDESEIRQYAVKCLSSVWNVKFNNVHCMANLLAGLVLYHDYIGIQVVDAVLEDIRIGMEINQPKFNQRRVSVVKYLGELYNYRMVESSVIFKTLYSFLRFGVALDANIPSLLDPPEHLFRIRLSCTLLDTCGQFFDRGTSKKKLDCFLVYFQQYILFKRGLEAWKKDVHPFPMDVDNAIADTFESLRPKLKLFATLEEANEGVQELEKEYVEKLGDVIALTRANPSQQPGGPLSTITEGDENNVGGTRRLSFTTTNTEDEDEYDSDEDSERVRRPGLNLGTGSNPNSQSTGLSQNTEEAGYDTEENMHLESAGENEEDDMVTVLTGGPRLVKCEEDDEFTSAFDKMMCDNIQQRTVDVAKVPQLEISVPVAARNKPKKTYDLFQQEEAPNIPTTMNFTLMTRSGKKQQYHDFEVPISSELAANLRNREMAEMLEKQRMKELTLNINERQEEEDYQEMIASLQKPAMAAPGVTAVPGARKPRFHHPKGAPDELFHASGNRKW